MPQTKKVEEANRQRSEQVKERKKLAERRKKQATLMFVKILK